MELGDCYEAAGQWMVSNPGTDCFLIHAEVIGQGSLEGIPYGHAFILCDDMVHDYSNGRNIVIPKVVYYHIGKIEERYMYSGEGYRERHPQVYQYSREEAMDKLVEYEHWGPWDLETESGY